MTRRIRAAAICCVLACSAVPANAQTVLMNGVPARDNAPEPTGTGRIRGRVVDAESGAVLRDTMLTLTGGGLRQPRNVGTDDEGRYEFENLPSGRFNLTANKPGYMTLAYGQRRPFESGRPVDLADKQTLDDVNFAVPRGGVIVARVTDENGEPLSDVRVMAQRYRFAGGQRVLTQVAPIYQGTDDRGEVRIFGLPPGEYYVSSASSGPGTNAAAKGAAYVPTFFPGTASVDVAERVSVQVGKEVSVSFQLLTAKRTRVNGIVRRADGSPAPRASVLMLPRTGVFGFIRDAVTQADGTFSFADVTPGEYSLQTQFSGPATTAGAPGAVTPAAAAAAEREQGRANLNVTGGDVNGVVLALAKPARVRGRIVLDGQPPANFRFSTLRPSLTPIVTGGSFIVMSTPAPTTQEDGTFLIDNVFDPGVARIGVLPTGWSLKAVMLGGKDVTDTPLIVDSGAELSGVEIVLTQVHAELSGNVTDAKGAAAGDYTVIVFPEDRTQWTMTSRFMATARPDQQGQFKVASLPPGKYLASAVDYIETGAERDPELLERLRERATPLTLGEGDTKIVTLPLQ